MPKVLLLAFLLAPHAAYGQDEKPTRVPQKGDTIVATGCLRGSALESQETRLKDDDSATIAVPIAYRLTGDKDLLKELKSGHSRHLEEITGVLKSRLPDGKGPGKQVGNTRIYIGVGPANPAQAQALPVLQVTSFKHIGTECGR